MMSMMPPAMTKPLHSSLPLDVNCAKAAAASSTNGEAAGLLLRIIRKSKPEPAAEGARVATTALLASLNVVIEPVTAGSLSVDARSVLSAFRMRSELPWYSN